jgi:hypothetical protein
MLSVLLLFSDSLLFLFSSQFFFPSPPPPLQSFPPSPLLADVFFSARGGLLYNLILIFGCSSSLPLLGPLPKRESTVPVPLGPRRCRAASTFLDSAAHLHHPTIDVVNSLTLVTHVYSTIRQPASGRAIPLARVFSAFLLNRNKTPWLCKRDIRYPKSSRFRYTTLLPAIRSRPASDDSAL